MYVFTFPFCYVKYTKKALCYICSISSETVFLLLLDHQKVIIFYYYSTNFHFFGGGGTRGKKVFPEMLHLYLRHPLTITKQQTYIFFFLFIHSVPVHWSSDWSGQQTDPPWPRAVFYAKSRHLRCFVQWCHPQGHLRYPEVGRPVVQSPWAIEEGGLWEDSVNHGLHSLKNFKVGEREPEESMDGNPYQALCGTKKRLDGPVPKRWSTMTNGLAKLSTIPACDTLPI